MKKIEHMLESGTNEILQRIKKEYEDKINEEICKTFEIKTFKFIEEYEGSDFTFLQMDRYIIIYNVDRYNNLYVSYFSEMLPFEYIAKFRKFLNEYGENIDAYNHRSGTSFLIKYLNKFYEAMNRTILENMCKLDDFDGEKGGTFRDWLHSSSGN